MRKNLKNDLHKLYTNSPSPNPSNIKDTIIRVRKIVIENQLNGLTFWEFYFQQFGFIRKKVWLIQFLVLLFCALKLYYYPKSIDVLSLILSIAPLIFLSGITELSRTYTYGTIELELSTKYTLNQIMISRISILGLMNILSITILVILIRTTTTLHLYSIFVYILVPFMMTCFGCLLILNRFKNKECNYYCFAFGIFIMVSMSISKTFLPKLYIASSLYIWSIMLVIAIIGASIQIYKLINNCTKNYDFI